MSTRTNTPYGGITPITARGSENGNRYSPTGVEELTYSGEMISLLDPRPEQIRISDIAVSLAAQVRFNGHCPLQPTIAQHSLAVEYIASELYYQSCSPTDRRGQWRTHVFAKAALMHDAAEYLVGDNIGGVKKLMRCAERHTGRTIISPFDVIEDRVQAAIVKRFDCSAEGWEDIIHEADCIACAYEMSYRGWCADAKVPDWVIFDDYHHAHIWECYLANRGGADLFRDRARQIGMED